MGKAKNHSPWSIFLFVHTGLLAAFGLLLGWYALTSRYAGMIIVCPMKDFLHLYCPLCGGTRALISLLRLDFPAALRYNPFVCVFALGFLFFDLRAFLRLLRRAPAPLSLPRFLFPLTVASAVLFFLLRNVLLIFAGIDPIGDLLPFWHP